MPWAVNSNDGQQSYPAPAGETLYIVTGDTGLSAVRAAPDDPALILGILAVQSYGAKLEAGNEVLRISPAGPARPHKNGSSNPPAEGFLLQAKTDNRIETTIVRSQDRITSPNVSGTLTLIWTPPQIQVQSSEKKDNPAESTEAVQAEDETEDDDEDLDNTVVPSVGKSQILRSTPHMSASRSEIIQETPTIDRVGDAVGLSSRLGPPELKKDDSVVAATVYSAAPQNNSIANDLAEAEEPTHAEMEDDNGKPELRKSSRHPKVQISKRPSPALEEETSSPSARTVKRRKVDNDSDSNTITTPVQTARKTAIKGKKRESAIKDSTPSRSQRSTQSSIAGSPVNVEGDYDGPKPRVALSNSTIQPNSTFVRWLKKSGGNIVDSVEGDCNILCIKEGTLLKTSKLLQAVAGGTPIVTDKWLMDSAKAGRFLPLDLYKPPDLEPVWKIPQNRLLESYTIFFTPALKAHYKTAFADMEKLCKAVGARRVVSKKPGGKDLYEKASIFLAEAEGDKDVPALLEVGHTCYTKDFLTHSIVVGEVDLASEEFRVQIEEPKPVKAAKKGRGRNS
ncbi:hypothetical protein P171DRAFT_426346 [Karstenula rhodostoma CBS 690.94]|uniref:BRCT domain-containing protein n=1 Tax=Karstenula rhodostoma CBS 690.94 TaxID=1392251 RepID=A0A9P4PV25_9PLEO|nr:hypothetical protein P171DRAFT_426346 [Karstenula rhodostoma CBS 690.94]